MNNTIFSPFNQTGTLEKANGPGVKEKKRPRQELAVAPKVAAMVNLLLQLKLRKKLTGLKTKKEKKDNTLQYMSYNNCAESTAVKKVILTSRARDNHGSIQVSICFFV